MNYEIKLGTKTYPVKVEECGEGGYTVTVEDRVYPVDFTEPQPHLFSLLVNDRSFEVGVDADKDRFSLYLYDQFYSLQVLDPRTKAITGKGLQGAADGLAEILAPMPGKVVKLLVAQGDEVAEGQGLIVVEAMKMENELKSPKAGVVKEILVEEGTAVVASAVLLVVE